MIRKLRIALANWIMPREYRMNPFLPLDYRPGSYFVKLTETQMREGKASFLRLVAPDFKFLINDRH